MAETINAYTAEPFSYAEARGLVDALGVSEVVAITLVRRGYVTPEAARAFLEADESHSPFEFGSMTAVVAAVRGAIEARKRITVHGDFDVDGVCATAILVGALRELGADCAWLIPDRMADGYGLSPDNVKRLADRGTQLLITVDCGITAVDEVALAKSLGVDVIVTDHHQAGPELPDCPILHPTVDGYPFEGLCGTAVAWKLASALREGSGAPPTETVGDDPGTPPPEAVAQLIAGSGSGVVPGASVGGVPGSSSSELDLVALATVADVVPLVGENRALVKKGLEEVRRARRPGIRALLEAAKCEPTQLDESDLGFRLAPRINAAGRLYRADAGVELFLTEDEARAKEIAVELNRANGERRGREREVDGAAEAARRELPEELREAPGLVVAGEGWHPGVVGIVASRLAERHYRPVVVVSLDGEGGGRGSARSIPGFDLLAGLEACAEHLERFGGHKAAAGLELRAEKLDAFRAAFAAHAAAVLGPEELRKTERVDAVVGGARLGLELAEELERLAPFGMGNPGVRLLVPGARVRDVRTMGQEGKHCRFSLHSGSSRALGVAFGRSQLGVGEDDAVDAAVRLEVNRWNGSVEPRVVLRELYPVAEHPCTCPDPEWWGRFEAELRLPLDASGDGGEPAAGERETIRARGSVAATVGQLLSAGEDVLAVCADSSRRARLADLARFAEGEGAATCERCGGIAVDALRRPALTDFTALERAPEIAGEFAHVVLVDPPSSAHQEALAGRALDGWSDAAGHPGYLHLAWEEGGVAAALATLEEQMARRPVLIGVFRELREAGEASGEELWAALRGAGPRPRSPEVAARCFRVLEELGLVQGAPDGGRGTVGVVSSEETQLERSAAFRAYGARHQEGLRYLERRKRA